MGPVVEIIKEISFEWNKRQQQLQSIGLSKKEANLLQVENRKMNILDKLKAQGGPFSCEEQVQAYMDSNFDKDQTQKRMKDEVTYARDTCLSLPRSHRIFRIFNTCGKKNYANI